MEVTSRFPEIDMARGIAILMMIIFHTVFDLSFFNIIPVDISDGFWRYFAISTASLFLLIVGISLTISRTRAAASLSGYQLALKFIYRGCGIFLLGLLVTAATWLYLKEGFVIFGILHLIGVSVIISTFFFPLKKYNIGLGFIFIAVGFFFSSITGPIWLLFLGIHPATFSSVDYEPLFPWFGMVLIGMGLGDYFYNGNIRKFPVPRVPGSLMRALTFPGRHSLVIYLIHQPIIILLLGVLTNTKVL